MRAHIEGRVASGRYASASEYIRDLIVADQDRQRREQLEGQLLDGLRSGTTRPVSRVDFDRARTFVRELAPKKRAKGK